MIWNARYGVSQFGFCLWTILCEKDFHRVTLIDRGFSQDFLRFWDEIKVLSLVKKIKFDLDFKNCFKLRFMKISQWTVLSEF